MFDEFKNLNIDACSDTDLIALVRQVFPIISELLKRFSPEPLSCQDCPKNSECNDYNKSKLDRTCLILESFLPGRYEGTGYREKNSGMIIDEYEYPESDIPENTEDEDNYTNVSKDYLRSIRKIRLDEEFLLYKNCPLGNFTTEQWEAVCLRFEHGLKQKKIAEIIGIKRSAVTDRLRRAKKNMKNYYKGKKS